MYHHSAEQLQFNLEIHLHCFSVIQYYFSTILLSKARKKTPETQENTSTRVPSFSSLGTSTIFDELLQHEEYSCSLSWTFYVRGLCTPYKFKDMNVVKVLHMIKTNFPAICFFLCFCNLVQESVLSNTELNGRYLCSGSNRAPYWNNKTVTCLEH